MGKTVRLAIANIDLAIAGVMMAILVATTFLGVVMRYLFSSPFSWMEEVQLLCQVWVVFCGGVAAFRLGSHVEIEFIAEACPEAGQKVLLVVNSIVTVAVLGYLAYQCWQYLQVFILSGRTTTILQISYVAVYVVAPVSMLFMIVNYIIRFKDSWKLIQTSCRDLPHAGENEEER